MILVTETFGDFQGGINRLIKIRFGRIVSVTFKLKRSLKVNAFIKSFLIKISTYVPRHVSKVILSEIARDF